MSEEQKYNVVYAGAIQSGFDETQVKAGFVEQMKIPEDKVDQLFSGKRMTLKKSLNKQKAELWQQKLLKIGAEVAIIPFVSTKPPVKPDPRMHTKKTKVNMQPIDNKQETLSTSQKEYDEEMNARIRKAKAMIATQQIEQQLTKSKETSLSKKLLVFSFVLGFILLFLYFYLDSKI